MTFIKQNVSLQNVIIIPTVLYYILYYILLENKGERGKRRGKDIYIYICLRIASREIA